MDQYGRNYQHYAGMILTLNFEQQLSQVHKFTKLEIELLTSDTILNL